jgi:tRNA threonylcarbamoyladenosine biosynthesis protein TsaE
LLHTANLLYLVYLLLSLQKYVYNMVALPAYFCDMEWIYTLENIHQVAKEFWKATGTKQVFAFYGDMGAGKTTFINALCTEKGIKNGVSSPTFSIINEYVYDCEGTQKLLFHIDLYRLQNQQEAVQAGVEDCIYSQYICLVEWPEKAPGIFPDDTVRVYIDIIDDKTRMLKIANN